MSEEGRESKEGPSVMIDQKTGDVTLRFPWDGGYFSMPMSGRDAEVLFDCYKGCMAMLAEKLDKPFVEVRSVEGLGLQMGQNGDKKPCPFCGEELSFAKDRRTRINFWMHKNNAPCKGHDGSS